MGIGKMRKQSFLFAWAGLSLLFLASCEKEADQPEVIPAGHTQLVALSEEPTRTTLDGHSVLWQTGDCINVMDIGSHSSGSFFLVSGAGTTTGTFQGGDIQQSKEYYALYPFMTGLSKSNSRYNFRISQDQAWQEGSFGQGANIMVSTFTDPTQPLLFRHVLGALKLSLTGSSCIYKISVTDANSEQMLWGNAKLLLNGTQGTNEQTLELDGGDNTAHLLCPLGVQLSGTPTAFYLALPQGALSSGMTVRIYAQDDILLDEFSTTKDNSIARAQVRSMPTREVVSDPSLKESANSYILYRPGKYKIKAVKGNSAEALTGAKDAVLLWEGSNSATAPAQNSIVSNVSYKSGYVYFTLEEGIGNAVVAVRDAEEHILWSWHIWVPETEVQALPRASDYLMDRNLGASLSESTDGVATIGLFYEWGRKDPFPGSSSWSSSGTISYMGTVGNSFTTSERNSTTGTIDYATAHPQEYLYCKSGTDSNQDWLYEHDNTLWAAEKTKYDPCPPGWQLPAQAVFSGSATYTADTIFGADYTYYGAATTWLPCGGYRFASDGNNHSSGTQVYYWSYEVNVNKSRATMFKAVAGSKTSASLGRSVGCNVRCMAGSLPEPSVEPRPAAGGGADEVKDFLNGLPAGAKVSSITSTASGPRVEFSTGDEVTLDSSVFSTDTAVAEGYWHADGTQTDAATTSGNYLLHLPRKVLFHFADGTRKSFDKDISWGMVVEKQSNKLFVWMGHSGSNQWIRHTVNYRYKAYTGGTTYPDYYDNWGLGKPTVCTWNGGTSFTNGQELFLGGEAEAAVQTYDVQASPKKTYSGGVLHGWENIYTDGEDRLISFTIDGEPVGETETLSRRAASRVEIVQKTKIARAYSPEGLENAYADVLKHWVIENGTVTISVEYTFLEETEVFQGKFGMFCVKRLETAGDTGSTYITRLAWKDSTPGSLYEVTEGWESGVPASAPLKSRDSSATRVEEYGDAGVSFAMQFDSGTLKSSGGFNIGTNGNNYNKIYFDICGGYTASQNEKLSSTVHWELDFVDDHDKF